MSVNKFLISFLLLFAASVAAVPARADTFVAQSSAGGNTGADCANARIYTSLVSGDWVAGNTIHLCGTITGAANAQLFSVVNSGTSGNPITIKWETGAIVQAPYCQSANGCLSLNGQSWIVVDGGTNGIIQNTANGTSLANQQNSTLIRSEGGTNVIIKNLSMLNVYVHTNGDGAGGSTYGIYARHISNLTVGPNNTLTQADVALLFLWDGGESNLAITGNTFSGANQDIEMGTSNLGVTSFTNVTVVNNTASNWVNWDEPGNGYHHNFFHPFTNVPGSSLVGTLLIYNNSVHGDIGQNSTSFIFIENNNGGSGGTMGTWYIFNNLFHKTNHVIAGGSGLVAVLSDNGFLLNNTFLDDDTSSNAYIAFHPYGAGWTSKNNIFQQNGYYITADQALTGANNNVYYLHGNSTPWDWIGNYVSSLSAWQSACSCDSSSIVTNPLLNPDLTLPIGSPAAGSGANLTSLGITALDNDKAGVARPGSGAWDIGAYQSAGGGGLAIVTSALPGGTQGVFYSATVSAIGGTLPYSWTISAGSLPAPLTIGAGTGTISGIPAAAGLSSFTVRVTDAVAATATQPLSITVASSGGGAPSGARHKVVIQ